MTLLDHSRFYRYAELMAHLKAFATSWPRYVRLEVIGQSHEGRDLVVVCLTDHEAKAPADKPAFWIDGNIHATEVSASAACLYFIDWMLKGIGVRPEVNDCLERCTFYICPRVNPDGAEWALADSPRYIRSSTRNYPFDEPLQAGLQVEDMDGDGAILEMRIADPNGPWKAHPQDARLMVKRDPGERGGNYYRVLPEGRFINYDADRLLVPAPPQGLDLNRNFPAHWRQEFEQEGAGPYPGSEPEVRALIEFIVAHPNIGSGLSFHTFSGVLLRPSSQTADDQMAPEDLWIYQTMGKKAQQLTGYPALSMFEDFTYYPGQTLGGSFDWLYEHQGAFMWVAEIWDPRKAAGIETTEWIHWFRDHEIDDDLKMLEWSDRELDGQGYLPWRSFEHPQLGTIELGGWNRAYALRNPPPKYREQELARFPAWIVWQALLLPCLEWRDIKLEVLDEGAKDTVFRLRATVQNSGWLPTYVTKLAVRKKLLRGVIADLALPAGVTLVSGKARQFGGELDGWSGMHTAQSFFTPENITADRGVFDWVLQGPKGVALQLSVAHARAGRLTRSITLM